MNSVPKKYEDYYYTTDFHEACFIEIKLNTKCVIIRTHGKNCAFLFKDKEGAERESDNHDDNGLVGVIDYQDKQKHMKSRILKVLKKDKPDED